MYTSKANSAKIMRQNSVSAMTSKSWTTELSNALIIILSPVREENTQHKSFFCNHQLCSNRQFWRHGSPSHFTRWDLLICSTNNAFKKAEKCRWWERTWQNRDSLDCTKYTKRTEDLEITSLFFIITKSYCNKSWENNYKVQHVPSIPQIRIFIDHKAFGNDLEYHLHYIDCQKCVPERQKNRKWTKMPFIFIFIVNRDQLHLVWISLLLYPTTVYKNKEESGSVRKRIISSRRGSLSSSPFQTNDNNKESNNSEGI